MNQKSQKIYQDWLKELPQFMADTPVTEVIMECQKALRRVLQGTTLKNYEEEEISQRKD